MTKKALTIAWVSSIALAAVIALDAIMFPPSSTPTALSRAFTRLESLTFAWVYWDLKRLLNARFKFHDANTYIWIVIVLMSIEASVFRFENDSGYFVLFVTLLMLLHVICWCTLAAKLGDLANDLYGFLAALRVTVISGAICVAAGYLFYVVSGALEGGPKIKIEGLGDVFGFISSVFDFCEAGVLGMIFLRASREPASNTSAVTLASAEIQKRRNNRRASFCVQCGERLEDGDRFCSVCGAPTKHGPSVSQAVVAPVVIRLDHDPPGQTLPQPMNASVDQCLRCAAGMNVDDAFCSSCGYQAGRNLSQV